VDSKTKLLTIAEAAVLRKPGIVTSLSDSETGAAPGEIVVLRRELAQAERELLLRAGREAVRLAEAERVVWRKAQADCLQLERIRRNAKKRLEAIIAGDSERFAGERELAEMALRDVKTWELRSSAAFTIVSFACRRERLRYLRGGSECEAIIRKASERGNVYTDQGYFQEILI
jgi:hypothetical protein